MARSDDGPRGTQSEPPPPKGTVAIVPNRLYALGGTVNLDGRISWAPKIESRYQAVNCYLLKEGNSALMIDTGLPIHRGAIMSQLERLMEKRSALKLFITRPEFDAVGNLGAVKAAYSVTVMAGGSENPFDAFDDANAATGARSEERKGPGPSSTTLLERIDVIHLSASRAIPIIVPTLRSLPSYWPFDVATRTLFTSDVFGHTDQPDPAPVHIITSSRDPSVTMEAMARHLFCKFWWLPGSNTDSFRTNLSSIITELDPITIAPTHGCILHGRDVVRHHTELLLNILSHC